jgi:hypothetical protein
MIKFTVADSDRIEKELKKNEKKNEKNLRIENGKSK